MSSAKPLDERILRASLLSVRARAYLNLFAFLMWQDNLDKFEDVLAERWDLFLFIRTAAEHEYLARIMNLFTPRSDTDNFPELVSKAEREAAISTGTCASIRARIASVQSTVGVVKTIRHKVVSHQDTTYTKPEMYKLVKPTLPMFLDLSDQSLAIAGALCSARGLVPEAVPNTPVEQLEKMLSELQHHARPADDRDAS